MPVGAAVRCLVEGLGHTLCTCRYCAHPGSSAKKRVKRRTARLARRANRRLSKAGDAA